MNRLAPIALVVSLSLYSVAGCNGEEKSSPADPTPTSSETGQDYASPTATTAPAPDIDPVTVEEYPTLLDAARRLYVLNGEGMLAPPPHIDVYNQVLYGLQRADFSEANRDDRRWDLIDQDNYARGVIAQANGDLIEAGVKDANGEPLQYWFKADLGKVQRIEGMTVHFISKMASNLDQLPQYQPELGEAFAYAFGDNLPGSGMDFVPIEYMTLDKVDGVWIIVDEGYKKKP